METLKETWFHLIFCVAAGALSCGRNLSPEAGTGGVAGAAGVGGAGGVAGAAGETGGSECPVLEVHRIAVCWDRNLNFSSEGRFLSDLSFVGSVEPDESYCVQG
jgi:hypothetical protein